MKLRVRKGPRRATPPRHRVAGGALGLLVLCFGPGEGLHAEPASDASTPNEEATREEHPLPERVYADAFLVWIYSRPERDPAPIGYLRGGQSAALRSHEGRPKHLPVRRTCGRGWYAVEPAGFVCLDRHGSLEPTRYFRSMSGLAPQEGPYLFDYALSMGTPSYRRLPDPDEWERKERIFGRPRARPLPPHWRGHEELVGAELPERTAPPWFLRDEGSVSRSSDQRLVRRDVPFGSMLAVTSAFEHADRTFLQSADGTIVPADRMRLFRRSEFEGVELGGHRVLPLAWPRKTTKTYRIQSRCLSEKADDPSGTSADRGRLVAPEHLEAECLEPTARVLAPRIPHALSGRVVQIAGTDFAELGNTEEWAPVSYLFVAERRTVRDDSSYATNPQKKWIHFRISQGTLVSYEGTRPVFATLASPGIGGTPAPGADPLSTRTTPVGTFQIQFKHVSDDMSPEHGEHRKFWIADVPYAQYFDQPFAIHVAYWHESFGDPMSGGCINVSPRDGARLFSFTDPALPKGWYGVGSSREFGRGTTIVIDR